MEFRPWLEWLAETTAAYEDPVLLLGPTGSGKEYFARRIAELRWKRLDAQGQAQGRPFVALNIGALDATFLRSELRGYVRGAFTDAKTDKPGVFELAGRGTCFLDEIGALPPDLQVHLLRVLEERVVVRLGDTKPRRVECLIVAATNRSEVLFDGDVFRQDLRMRFGRILELPGLADRREERLEIYRDVARDIEENWSGEVGAPGILEELFGPPPWPRGKERRRRWPKVPEEYSLAYLALFDPKEFAEGNLRALRRSLVWEFRFFSEWARYWRLPKVRAFAPGADLNVFELLPAWESPTELYRYREHVVRVMQGSEVLWQADLTRPRWAFLRTAALGVRQGLSLHREFAQAVEQEEKEWAWREVEPLEAAKAVAGVVAGFLKAVGEEAAWRDELAASLARGIRRYRKYLDRAEDAAEAGEHETARRLLARAVRALKQSVGFEKYVPAGGLVTKEVDARIQEEFPWLESVLFVVLLGGYLVDLVEAELKEGSDLESFALALLQNHVETLGAAVEEELQAEEERRREPSLASGQAEAKGFAVQGPPWPSLEELKARYAAFVYEEAGRSKKAAQEILGISRNSLNKYLAEAEGTGPEA